MRVVERSTEGIHALIARGKARARSAKLPYLSLELRLPQLLMYAVTDAASFQAMEEQYRYLSTLVGFREAIQKLGQLSLGSQFAVVTVESQFGRIRTQTQNSELRIEFLNF